MTDPTVVHLTSCYKRRSEQVKYFAHPAIVLMLVSISFSLFSLFTWLQKVNIFLYSSLCLSMYVIHYIEFRAILMHTFTFVVYRVGSLYHVMHSSTSIMGTMSTLKLTRDPGIVLTD